MATALDSNVTTATGITKLLQDIFGKTGGTETTKYDGGGTLTNSGGTETKQTMVNVQDMMKQLLEGAGTAGYGKKGLAATLQGGKRAGVYGGKSTQLDLDDLLSRITTEASIAGAPTVTTKSPTTQTETKPTMTRSGINSQAGLKGSNLLPLLAGAYAWENRKKLKGMWDEFGSKPNFDATDAMEGEGFKNISEYLSKNEYYSGLENTGEPGGFSGAEQFMFSPAGDDSVSSSFSIESFAGDTVSDTFSVADSASYGAESSMDYGSSFDSTSGAFDGYSAAESAFAGGDVALDGAMDGASGAMGGFPVIGTLNALSDGEITSKEVGSVGGGWAGAQIGTMIMPGIGTVVGGVIGSVVGGSACFITTATLQAIGNSNDNAIELQTLRAYRDNWLLTHHPEDVQEYYHIAPQIVAAIDSNPNAAGIWRGVWVDSLKPAIDLVVSGHNEEAYEKYKAMVNTLKGSYLNG